MDVVGAFRDVGILGDSGDTGVPVAIYTGDIGALGYVGVLGAISDAGVLGAIVDVGALEWP